MEKSRFAQVAGRACAGLVGFGRVSGLVLDGQRACVAPRERGGRARAV